MRTTTPPVADICIKGRFKSFPVQDDRHFLTLCRYVEANPLRAKMVESARNWRWSSLADRAVKQTVLPTLEWPVDRPRDWTSAIERPMREQDAEQVRLSIQRDRPLGDDQWTLRTAKRLGLEYTIRPRGRQRVVKE